MNYLHRHRFAHSYRQTPQTPVEPASPPPAVVPREQPAPKSQGGALRLDRSYNFVDKVCVIDELRGLVAHSGLTFQALADEAGLSPQTVWCIFSGKTIGPRRTTLEALAKVFGKRLGLVDDRPTLS
jgi:Helix-turn-helix domain